MKAWVAKASRPEVVGGIGGFAGLFDASALKAYRRPLLATSTDGVGTKVAIAAAADRHDTIGHDLVGMVVDDLVVCGAEPLFMTDYIACGKVVPERIAAIVKGIAEGCVLAGCALVGGETAEHPGLLGPDEYDVAGAGTGVVEADRLLGAGPGPRRRRAGRDGAPAACTPTATRWCGTCCSTDGRLAAGPGRARARPPAGRRAARADPDLRARLPGADRRRSRCTRSATSPAAGWRRTWPGSCRRTCRPPSTGHLVPAADLRAGPRRRRRGASDELERTLNMGVGMVAVVAAADADRAVALLTGRGVPAWVLGTVDHRRRHRRRRRHPPRLTCPSPSRRPDSRG